MRAFGTFLAMCCDGSNGGAGDTNPPLSKFLIFMQFWAKFCKIIGWCTPSPELESPPGKSWIHHWCGKMTLTHLLKKFSARKYFTLPRPIYCWQNRIENLINIPFPTNNVHDVLSILKQILVLSVLALVDDQGPVERLDHPLDAIGADVGDVV